MGTLDASTGKCDIRAATGGQKGVFKAMTTAITRMITWLRGEVVGTDQLGNRYYQDRKVSQGVRRRRWVIYNGEDEASNVPSEWNAWLHQTTDQVPDGAPKRDWEKPHLPNQTGTPNAYRPSGHTLKGGQRASATGDYEAWTPE